MRKCNQFLNSTFIGAYKIACIRIPLNATMLGESARIYLRYVRLMEKSISCMPSCQQTPRLLASVLWIEAPRFHDSKQLDSYALKMRLNPFASIRFEYGSFNAFAFSMKCQF